MMIKKMMTNNLCDSDTTATVSIISSGGTEHAVCDHRPCMHGVLQLLAKVTAVFYYSVRC
jgi:hypothetical protein